MIKLIMFIALIGLIAWMATRLMAAPKPMPRSEAAKLLGIAESAGADAVVEAHKRLIARVHPDAGGNAELAARVNEARDILLKS